MSNVVSQGKEAPRKRNSNIVFTFSAALELKCAFLGAAPENMLSKFSKSRSAALT